MGRGGEVDQSKWPASGPRRQLLELLDRVRRDNGPKSLRAIARGMNLASPNRVGALLKGTAEPVNEVQLDQLVRALGGGDDEVAQARKLWAKARSSRSRPQQHQASAAQRHRSGRESS